MTTDEGGAHRTFAFGPFVLVPARQSLLQGDNAVRIGRRAFDILMALVERPGQIVSKRQLMTLVWPDVVVDDGNLKVNMAALRRTLGDETGAPTYIATITGRGYRFIAPVQVSVLSALPPSTSSPQKRLHNLPTGTTRIFGRADAIEAIWRELGDARVVSIVGAGGIGKTTVALAVAERAIRVFRDGVWLVELALLKDPDLIPSAIAAAIGVVNQVPTPLDAVCEFLGSREILLVLDSCEHIIDATAASVQEILTRTSGVKVLVTSREPLMVDAERVRRLRGLETPSGASAMNAEEALAFPAIQLFVDRASERVDSFQLSDADAPAVAEICRRLDGVALAIELAATRTDAFGVSGLLKQLDDRLRLLVGRRAGPERHRTLAATLDWSYSLLPMDEAALLRAVSVFAGVFNIDGAAAVSNIDDTKVAELLAQLAAKSLMVIDLDTTGIAYRLLETTRTDCFERMAACGEDQVVRQRHAVHVCLVLERATSEWAKRPAMEWALDYGRVLDDLRDALSWTGIDPSNRSLRIRLTLAGILLWNHFSLTGECRAHVAQAVADFEAAGLAGTSFEMKLKLWLGGSTMVTSDFKPQTLEAMRRALEIAVETGNTDYRLRCLSAIALYELWTGGHEAGLRTIEEFMSVAAAGDPSALPEGHVHAAIAELFLGRLEGARQRLESLRSTDLRYFDRSYGVRFLADTQSLLESVLAHVQWLMGYPDTAARTAAAAIDSARPTQHHLSLNTALSYACPIYYWSGQDDTCDLYATMLDEHVKRHGIVSRRPVAMFYHAALACTVGDVASGSVEALQRAVEEFRSINYLTRMPYYLGVVAQALVRQGRLGEAEAVVLEAIHAAQAQGERWCLPEVLRIQALVARGQGRLRQAEAMLLESMQVAQETQALSWRLRSANDLAMLWCAESRADEARQMLLPIYDAFTEGFATRDLLCASELLASMPAPSRMSQDSLGK